MLKFGSLFSGIGGFDLGFERAGMSCAWQVEIDPHCQKLLEKRFPNAKRYTDVREVGKHNLESVDLISGGFPCQDLSVAGKRAGLAGKRSGLWFEFHRVVAELKPRGVVIENVPGLLSSNSGRDFAIILRGLVKCGYGVAWRIFDARYFGVAQRRRRVFIVASLGDGSCSEILFESEGVSRDSAESGEARQRIAAPVKASPPSRRNGGSDPTVSEFVVTGTLSANRGGLDRPAGNANELDFCIPFVTSGEKMFDEKGIHRERIAFDVTPTLNAFDTPLTGKTLTSKNQRNDLETENLIAFDWQSGGDVRHNAGKKPNLQASQVPAIAFGHPGGQTLKLNEIANTINTQTGSETTAMIQGVAVLGHSQSHGLGVYEQSIANTLEAVDSSNQAIIGCGVRRLTPAECERLQGFPDGWTEGFTDSVRYRTLGNAVCVPVAEWIGKRIVCQERKERRAP